MRDWVAFMDDAELVAVGRWIEELATETAMNAEDIANLVIDEGVAPVGDRWWAVIVDRVNDLRKVVAMREP